ncbi:uncharacterized protein AMSG_09065 [Thecamonas trahens ATCC 50062]|uniref:Uncharacterized protein n=1 Tax=Thecamonas trahens ATCC 50062 TaxID=461836 RepID=A0A0L0DKX8_THETB|nr:hypothetical protein AMSG_09065 [Thecamonas trahens ATCC 50062]KNC52900.1 hypothetical protein AMSG_09065 [Thecamonas trahens ATCC 50062]|eukprot:XP_013754994.1 hypothetical protein AMSG_09065 [Thecamonas trahens ATCC 50062]
MPAKNDSSTSSSTTSGPIEKQTLQAGVERFFSITEAFVSSSIVAEIMAVSEGGENGEFLRVAGFVFFVIAWSLQTLTLLHNLARTHNLRSAMRFLSAKSSSPAGYTVFKQNGMGSVERVVTITDEWGKMLEKEADDDYFFGVKFDVKSILGIIVHVALLIVGILCFRGELVVEKITDAFVLIILPIFGELLTASDLWHKEEKAKAVGGLLGSDVVENLFAERKFQGLEAFVRAAKNVCNDLGDEANTEDVLASYDIHLSPPTLDPDLESSSYTSDYTEYLESSSSS